MKKHTLTLLLLACATAGAQTTSTTTTTTQTTATQTSATQTTVPVVVSQTAVATSTPAASTATSAAAPSTVAQPVKATTVSTTTTQPVTTQTTTSAPASAAKTPTPSTTTASTPTPTTVVATIGTTDYTYAQFLALFQAAVARNLNSQGIPYSADMASQFASYQANFLPLFVRNAQLMQVARAAGTKVDPAVVDNQVKAIQAQFKTDADLKAALTGSGFDSLDAYRQYVSDQALVAAYLDSVQGRFKFSDFLVQNFYNMHKASFTQPATACAKHILVGTEAEAKAIVTSIQSGTPANTFDKLAQAKSKDPGSAAKGGDLGCFSQGEMVPEFDKASFEGPLNQLQVVKSQFGYHVILVSKRTPAGLQPLSEVSDKIRQQLSAEASQKYVDAQMKRLTVKMYPERLTAAPASTPTKK